MKTSVAMKYWGANLSYIRLYVYFNIISAIIISNTTHYKSDRWLTRAVWGVPFIIITLYSPMESPVMFKIKLTVIKPTTII